MGNRGSRFSALPAQSTGRSNRRSGSSAALPAQSTGRSNRRSGSSAALPAQSTSMGDGGSGSSAALPAQSTSMGDGGSGSSAALPSQSTNMGGGGSGSSALPSRSTDMGTGRTDFSALPEGCIANVVSFTSPKDAGRLSAVSALFKSAAESDTVWERFLPPDYESTVATSSPQLSALLASGSKKKLYLTICPTLIDNGRKSFWLDKWSGKKCYMISARNFWIANDAPQHWRWISVPNFRFEQVAQLTDVCWLEIRGNIDTCMLSPSTLYSVYTVFKLADRTYGLDILPTEFSVGLAGDESCKRMVYWQPEDAPRGRNVRGGPIRGGAEERGDDGWLEIEMGEFFCKEGAVGGALELGIVEIKCGSWKSGLIFGGVEIRPKREK